MQMNTIRREHRDEPAIVRPSRKRGAVAKSWRASARGGQGRIPRQSPMAARTHVIGGGMVDREDGVKVGSLPMQEAARPSAAVRAAIVAWKSGNSDGAKGGRKAKALNP